MTLKLKREKEEEDRNKKPRRSNRLRKVGTQCCVCAEYFPSEHVILCSDPEDPHAVCRCCVKRLEDFVPPIVPLGCPYCHIHYHEDLFKWMPILEEVKLTPEELISRMRADKLNEIYKMSEYNYVSYVTALEWISDGGFVKERDYLSDWLPRVVLTYLESCDSNKREDWLRMFHACANNIRSNMLKIPDPLKPDERRYLTNYPCEDAIIYIIKQNCDEGPPLDPEEFMLEIYFDGTEITIESLSKVDPRYDGETEDDEREYGPSYVRAPTSFSEAMERRMDDMDICFLWRMRNFCKEEVDGETHYSFKDAWYDNKTRDYHYFMGVTMQDMRAIHMHPDIWFVPVRSIF